ncbi:MAG: dihydroorotate dehydrogenase electron transfer subunit [Anaerolineae bacterium]|jgi:dihydroorotate dehydrogenase electron transfer subunit|nr:dihydroorotate dehydrogenase electron transfer subunit [Anaerolineae bacterium]
MSGDLPSAARIISIAEENTRVKTFVLDAETQAQPGQFAMVWLPGVDEKPFSLVDDHPLTFTIARVGLFTRQVHALHVGDRLWWRGPFGRGFEIRETDGVHLLIGGGYGAAPLVFLARRLRAAGQRVVAIIGAKTKTELLLETRFAAMGCTVIVATEDGSAGVRGLATDVAWNVAQQETVAAVYACGPEGMLSAVELLCTGRHLPGQVSREGYMRCGLGVCGSCHYGPWLVCRDGPVFATNSE